jgi:hypothetical protein
MSVKATNFVRRLRGLTLTEKAVAMILADHDSHKGEGSFPGMTTVAVEASLKHRQTATDVVKRLAAKGVITTDNLSKGGRGKTTVYRFNYTLTNCNPEISVMSDNCNRGIAVSQAKTATLDPQNCNPEEAKLQPTDPETATGGLHEGVEGEKKRDGRVEAEPAAPILSKARTEELLEFVIKTASDLARDVSFTSKQAEAIRQTIGRKNPTEEALSFAVREVVAANKPMYVGSSLAIELAGRLGGYSERKQREKNEAEEHAKALAAPDDWFPAKPEPEQAGDPFAV